MISTKSVLFTILILGLQMAAHPSPHRPVHSTFTLPQEQLKVYSQSHITCHCNVSCYCTVWEH